MSFIVLVVAAALSAGAIASVAGFGIGALLTPTFSTGMTLELAVAAAAVPHAAGTLVRFWTLRRHLDRTILLSFGATSAIGGLAGAVLHSYASNPILRFTFALLLIFSGLSGLSGLSRRMRFRGAGAWIAGGVSGMFGGLVGNHGGIRAAAMLGLDIPRDQFVATATAIALIVDMARLPIYFAAESREIAAIWPLISLATLGTILGTLAGARILSRIPPLLFYRLVSMLVLLVGLAMLASWIA